MGASPQPCDTWGHFLTGAVPIGRSERNALPVARWGASRPKSAPATPSRGAWASARRTRRPRHLRTGLPGRGGRAGRGRRHSGAPPTTAPRTRTPWTSCGKARAVLQKARQRVVELRKARGYCSRSAPARGWGEPSDVRRQRIGHWACECPHKEHVVGLMWWDGDPGHDALADLEAWPTPRRRPRRTARGILHKSSLSTCSSCRRRRRPSPRPRRGARGGSTLRPSHLGLGSA